MCSRLRTQTEAAIGSIFSGLISWHAPLGEEVVLVVVLDTAPDAVEKEGDAGVEHDVAVEVLVGLVQHAPVVARVDVVPPAVLGGVDVELRHSQQGHLLVVPVALDPAHPVAPRVAAQPNDARAEPEVHRAALVGGHDGLLAAAVDHGVGLQSCKCFQGTNTKCC